MRSCVVIAALLAFLFAPFGAVLAQTTPLGSPPKAGDPPFVFKADQLDFDRQNGIVTASGGVEITQGERTLLADKVLYFQRTDTAVAEGNVTLLDPSENVIFGDRVELSGDLKDGVVEGVRLRMANNARVAAAGGRRTGGFRTEMRKAVYSPCELCKDNPDRAPLWQIKSMKVVHDEVDKDVEYTDAWLEIYGIPVAYLPYFSHPDPSVERRTGFLAPTYGNDDLLGFVLRTPFYIDIAPNQDATFTPIFTTQEGVVLSGEYRHLFTDSAIRTDASVTHASTEDGDKDVRGHIFANYGVDIDDNWRGKLDVALTTDDTYLRRYDFDSRSTLVNHAQLEGFWDRDYAAANAYAFQGLRADDEFGTTPFITPLLDYNFVSDPGVFGSFWTFDSNVMVLTRTEGTDSRRLSLKGGWQLPYTSPIGELYRLYATVQTDGYSVDDQQRDPSNPNSNFSGVTGRFFPQAGLDWRFPFVRNGQNIAQTVEPVAGVIVAPNVGRQDKIPNEDSRDVELDDTNIFDANRFTGLDRVEGGSRVYYGLRSGIYADNGAEMSLFLGQSFRFRENPEFSEGSGLNDELSDVVGSVYVAPVDWVDILYRFRVDTNIEPQRHDVIARLGNDRLRLDAEYVFIERAEETSEFGDREEITLGLKARLTERWSIGAQTRRDLADNGGALSNEANVTYADECIIISIDYSKRFFEDRDIRPSESVFLRITLRTLGDVGTSTTP